MIPVAKYSLRCTTLIITNCSYCNKKFKVAPYYLNRGQGKYCSLTCRDKAQIGKKRKLSKQGRKNIIESNKLKKGRKWTIDQRKRLSLSLQNSTKVVESRTDEWREKIAVAQRGEKGNNWKGGLTPRHYRIRKSYKYRLWRNAVLKRDNYTCVFCDLTIENRVGNNAWLEADHIKPLSKHPELVFEIDNGRTLCYTCHRELNKSNNYYRS